MSTVEELRVELDALFGPRRPEAQQKLASAAGQGALPGIQPYGLHSAGPLETPLWAMTTEKQAEVLASTPELSGHSVMRIPEWLKKKWQPG